MVPAVSSHWSDDAEDYKERFMIDDYSDKSLLNPAILNKPNIIKMLRNHLFLISVAHCVSYKFCVKLGWKQYAETSLFNTKDM